MPHTLPHLLTPLDTLPSRPASATHPGTDPAPPDHPTDTSLTQTHLFTPLDTLPSRPASATHPGTTPAPLAGGPHMLSPGGGSSAEAAAIWPSIHTFSTVMRFWVSVPV